MPAPLKQFPSSADKINMSVYHCQAYQNGFTMVEMLIVICIIAIMSALALPNYQTLNANNNATSLTVQLNASLRLAKVEAIRRNTPVQVCALSSPTNYVCNNSAITWQNGWMIYVPATSEVVKVFKPPATSAISIAPNALLVFSGTGLLQAGVGPNTYTAYIFTIKPSSCTKGYQLNIGLGGQTTSASVTCP